MKESNYRYLKPDGMRVLFIYLMLENKQIVNFDRITQAFEISYRTFGRAIASIRDALNNSELAYKCEVIFNRKRNTYELIKY